MITNFNAGVGANGHKLLWSADLDDVAETLTLTVTHTKFDDSPAIGPPQLATITVQRNTGQPLVLNMLTDGTAFDGGEANIVNTGPRTRAGVRLSRGPGRSQVITHSTQYQAPVA